MKQKNKILFYGDPHGHYSELISAVERLSPAAVVILGDLGLKEPLEQVLASIVDKTELWFIHGNHDTDSDEYYDFSFGCELAHRNLHGRVVDIAGIKIAGLGGVFRGKVWHPSFNDGVPQWDTRENYMHCQPSIIKRNSQRYGGLPRQHNSSIWPEDVARLSQLQADILVTHEAPSCHPYGFDVLDTLAMSLGVKRIFHGHHHEDYHSDIGSDEHLVLVDGVALAKCKNELGETV